MRYRLAVGPPGELAVERTSLTFANRGRGGRKASPGTKTCGPTGQSDNRAVLVGPIVHVRVPPRVRRRARTVRASIPRFCGSVAMAARLLLRVGPDGPHRSTMRPRQDKRDAKGPVPPRKSGTGDATAQGARTAADGPSGDKTSPEAARPRDGPLGRAPVSAVQPALPCASSTRPTVWPSTGDHSSRRAASRGGL